MLLAVAYMIGFAPVQVDELLHACAQLPRLLGAVWLIAAAILRTLPAANGRSQDRGRGGLGLLGTAGKRMMFYKACEFYMVCWIFAVCTNRPLLLKLIL